MLQRFTRNPTSRLLLLNHLPSVIIEISLRRSLDVLTATLVESRIDVRDLVVHVVAPVRIRHANDGVRVLLGSNCSILALRRRVVPMARVRCFAVPT